MSNEKPKANEGAARFFAKILFIVFAGEMMYALLPNIMPVGFILLFPLACLSAYIEFGHALTRFRSWRLHRELDRDLRSVTNPARLNK